MSERCHIVPPTGKWSIGIDYSTKSVALVAIQDTRMAYRFEKLPPSLRDGSSKGAHEAARSGVRRFATYFLRYRGGIDLVAVEAPLLNNCNVQTAIKMGMVAGAIQSALQELGLSYVLVQPSTWKKEALGHGKLDKEEVTAECLRRWPVQVGQYEGNQDLTDARAIAQYAYQTGVVARLIG